MRAERYQSLDGLRGLAAVAVTIYHFCCAYIPSVIPDYSAHPWWGSDTPLAIFYNGGFAVAIFFVLSGFVVANSAAKRRLPVVLNLFQRYLRLAGPVLAGVLFGWLMLKTFPEVHRLKLSEPANGWLNDVYDGNLPSLPRAIADGVLMAFWNGYSYFNNPLWTMRIELIGSWLLYLIYGLSQDRGRLLALFCYLLLPLFVALPEFSAFAAGALLREAAVAGRLPHRWPLAALFAGILFGSMMKGYGDRIGLSLPALFALGEPHKFWHVAAALLVLYAILNLPGLKILLASPFAQFLGKISFGLYLVHAPLLYTVFGFAYLSLPSQGAAWILLLLAAFLLTAILLGYLLAIAVDQPVLNGLRAATDRIRARSLAVSPVVPE